MADPSEILNVIAAQVAAIVYPNGTGFAQCYRHSSQYLRWLARSQRARHRYPGRDNAYFGVSDGRRAKIPTALGRPYRAVDCGDPSVIATVSGTAVTLSGTVSTPQNLYFLVDGSGYHYSVQSGDTLTSIATAITTLIPNASNVEEVISLPQATQIVARVGASVPRRGSCAGKPKSTA
ncbi:hypothetical protein O1V64_17980 [Rouxiella badensis]|nr:hypothetical protein O1V64_17980 [Rouxiella badensis]